VPESAAPIVKRNLSSAHLTSNNYLQYQYEYSIVIQVLFVVG
jgi:hypothetical protein